MNKILLALFFALTAVANGQGIEVSYDKSTKKWGYMRNDSMVIAPRFTIARDFTGKFAWAKSKGKWGLINLRGEWVIEPTYQKIEEFDDEYSLVIRKKKFGLVDIRNGVVASPCLFQKRFFFEELNGFGKAAVVVQKKKAGLINSAGKIIVPCLYDADKMPFAEAGGHFYQVKQKKKMGLINWSGKLVIPCQFDEALLSDADTSTVSTKKKNKYGLYATSGDVIAECLYDYPISFDEDGFAAVVLNKKYGLINRKGKLVLPCQYANDDALFTEREKLKK
ncbi:MAG: WG repeat-containing protein [Bacteroidetes bacterium]|nr:WG repeat-containing protein [Bacteroidota bacterium]